MPTFWDAPTRAELVRRAATLTPAHTAKWGKLSVAGMVAHLNDAARMALDELPVHSKGPVILRFAPVRHLVIHRLPFPKGAPTAAELLARSTSADLAAEQQAFGGLVERLGAATVLAASHPAFGPMTRHDWGVLAYRHIDHHLRQFGA